MPAEVYKILGQVAPNATTETELYQVSQDSWAVISTIVVCNRGDTQTTFRISVSKDYAATTTKDYIVYDAPIDPHETITFTLGITMQYQDGADVIRVYAGNASLSFNVFGSEILSYYEYIYQ